MFSILVESLKRLYLDYKITQESVIGLCEKGKISAIEKNYILGKE